MKLRQLLMRRVNDRMRKNLNNTRKIHQIKRMSPVKNKIQPIMINSKK